MYENDVIALNNCKIHFNRFGHICWSFEGVASLSQSIECWHCLWLLIIFGITWIGKRGFYPWGSIWALFSVAHFESGDLSDCCFYIKDSNGGSESRKYDIKWQSYLIKHKTNLPIHSLWSLLCFLTRNYTHQIHAGKLADQRKLFGALFVFGELFQNSLLRLMNIHFHNGT